MMRRMNRETKRRKPEMLMQRRKLEMLKAEIEEISLDDVLPTSDEHRKACGYVDRLSSNQRRSNMICLTTFAKANPCSGRVFSSRGSSRLAYLIKYLVYQRRKSETETETERVMYQRRSA